MPMTLEHVVHSLYPTQKCAPVACLLCKSWWKSLLFMYTHFQWDKTRDIKDCVFNPEAHENVHTDSILITNLSADKLESMTAYIKAWDKRITRWRTWLRWTWGGDPSANQDGKVIPTVKTACRVHLHTKNNCMWPLSRHTTTTRFENTEAKSAPIIMTVRHHNVSMIDWWLEAGIDTLCIGSFHDGGSLLWISHYVTSMWQH
jgi:hypothetical protein